MRQSQFDPTDLPYMDMDWQPAAHGGFTEGSGRYFVVPGPAGTWVATHYTRPIGRFAQAWQAQDACVNHSVCEDMEDMVG